MAKRGRKPGTVVGKYKKKAEKEVQQMQKSTNLLLDRGPFARVVQEVMEDIEDRYPLRMASGAMAVLQSAAEQFVVEVLQEADIYSAHANRSTLGASDVRLATRFFRLDTRRQRKTRKSRLARSSTRRRRARRHS